MYVPASRPKECCDKPSPHHSWVGLGQTSPASKTDPQGMLYSTASCCVKPGHTPMVFPCLEFCSRQRETLLGATHVALAANTLNQRASWFAVPRYLVVGPKRRRRFPDKQRHGTCGQGMVSLSARFVRPTTLWPNSHHILVDR